MLPKSLISSRPILITGCSSGIGYYVAHGLKKRGYRVFATARQPKDVARLQQEGLESLVLDLNDSQSIIDAVQTVLERTDGRLYGLFNNGGYVQIGAVEDITRQVLRQQFETNFFGTHELIRQILPTMRQQGEGRIIQNSSMAGIIAIHYMGAYSASKFAVEGLIDALRLELAGSGIFVSLIEPWSIASQVLIKATPQFKQHIDVKNSFHQKRYVKIEQSLLKEKEEETVVPSPEIVFQKLILALESKHPCPRYYVRTMAYFLAALKRLLPDRAMDWVLRRISL